MPGKSKIEWTEATWNPVTGCMKVSAGCDHCYAETFAERFRGVPGHAYEQGFDLKLWPERLDQPLRWRKPRVVFVNSMSDLFHADVPRDYIAQVFAVMALAERHTFQVLTKRPGRMRLLLNDPTFEASVRACYYTTLNRWNREHSPFPAWPLPNVWLGVSVENQHYADTRIPELLRTPAAVRFLSCEPLIGPVDLGGPITKPGWLEGIGSNAAGDEWLVPRIDWVIAGGESGHGARPMHPDWARSLRDQCQTAGVPFFFKQWGEWAPDTNLELAGAHTIIPEHGEDREFTAGWGMTRVGKKAAGRSLDGRTWDEYPQRGADG